MEEGYKANREGRGLSYSYLVLYDAGRPVGQGQFQLFTGKSVNAMDLNVGLRYTINRDSS